jgi:predicted glycogen debranching enzyme
MAAGFPEEDRGNIRQLLKAGRQFLTRTPAGRPTVIAGYHWFDDWGRDTLISLPGLAFCSGRLQEGIDILDALSGHEKKGLLPNFFSRDGKADAYNSVDASLWYFWAVHQMLKYTGNLKKIETSFWPVIYSIFGGLGTISGPVIGTVLLTVIWEGLKGFGLTYERFIIIGVLLILVVIFLPRGLVSLPEEIRKWRGSRKTTSEPEKGNDG